MENINKKSDTFADLLYKRGGCYERLGYYKKADKDLLDALNIIPDNKVLIACYHPSPRNVNTKLVTTPMINQLLIKAKKIAKF